jgi:hypothetical protein
MGNENTSFFAGVIRRASMLGRHGGRLLSEPSRPYSRDVTFFF